MKRTPVVGMISSWREGRLAYAAAASLLQACDRVYVLEGPVDGVDTTEGEPSEWPNDGHLIIREAPSYATDAAKRTALLRWVQNKNPGPCWGITLDGDEVLLFPELLRDYLIRAERENERAGMRLKVCEADGQVYESGVRCLRVDHVEGFVLSGYQITLKDSAAVVTLPMVPSEKAPIMGEPHILHRSYLRPPARNLAAARLSSQELDLLDELTDNRILEVAGSWWEQKPK